MKKKIFIIMKANKKSQKNYICNCTRTCYSSDDVGNLNITNASSINEGVYVCVAENVAGVVRKFTYLTVNGN